MRPGSFTDGLANETIIDPSGAGTVSPPPPPIQPAGAGGGGCFITTVICDLSMELRFSPVVTPALGTLLAILVSFGSGITLKRRRIRRKA